MSAPAAKVRHEETPVFDELRAIQREFGYLPVEQLHRMSQRLKIPISRSTPS